MSNTTKPISLTSILSEIKIDYVADTIEGFIKSYIKSNNIEDIERIIDLISNYQEFNELVKLSTTRLVYRGIGGKGLPPKETDILKQEKERRYVSSSSSKEIAEKYANKGKPDWSYLIQYNIDHNSIIVDIDMFNVHFGKNIKHEEEIIISIHQVNSMEILNLNS